MRAEFAPCGSVVLALHPMTLVTLKRRGSVPRHHAQEKNALETVESISKRLLEETAQA
jgi:hypothetical protein